MIDSARAGKYIIRKFGDKFSWCHYKPDQHHSLPIILPGDDLSIYSPELVAIWRQSTYVLGRLTPYIKEDSLFSEGRSDILVGEDEFIVKDILVWTNPYRLYNYYPGNVVLNQTMQGKYYVAKTANYLTSFITVSKKDLSKKLIKSLPYNLDEYPDEICLMSGKCIRHSIIDPHYISFDIFNGLAEPYCIKDFRQHWDI